MSFGGVDHHETDSVVDDAEQGEFSVDSIDGLATKDVHPHGRLEVAQVDFDLPSKPIEFGNVLLGLAFWIKQRCHDRYFA